MSEGNERDNKFEDIKREIHNTVFDSFDLQETDERIRRIRKFFQLCNELSDLVKKKH